MTKDTKHQSRDKPLICYHIDGRCRYLGHAYKYLMAQGFTPEEARAYIREMRFGDPSVCTMDLGVLR